MIDLSIVKKHSPRSLAINGVFFTCVGSIEIGSGIQQLLNSSFKVGWVDSLLFGTAFLAYGIFWVVMLLRRADSRDASSIAS